MTRCAVGLLVAALAPGCGPLDLDLTAADSRRASPIIGGQPESGYPAVGALISQGEAFCTGTLVTSAVVVTAAHCLQGESAADISFFIGQNVNNAGAGVSMPVDELLIHPDFSWDAEDGDIGVLRLATAAMAAPMAWRTQPMAEELVGQEPLFVGYGVTAVNAQATGVKYSVRIPIAEVLPTTFLTTDPDHNTCWGDSGGPALLEQDGEMTLIGVTSWGDDYCREFGVNMRVDAYADFIQGFIDGDLSGTTGDAPADICEEQGWYGDGVCDWDCLRPDPDCDADGGDFCEQLGWYGDGYCDTDCPQPDPDCGDEPAADGGDGGSSASDAGASGSADTGTTGSADASTAGSSDAGSTGSGDAGTTVGDPPDDDTGDVDTEQAEEGGAEQAPPGTAPPHDDQEPGCTCRARGRGASLATGAALLLLLCCRRRRRARARAGAGSRAAAHGRPALTRSPRGLRCRSWRVCLARVLDGEPLRAPGGGGEAHLVDHAVEVVAARVEVGSQRGRGTRPP